MSDIRLEIEVRPIFMPLFAPDVARFVVVVAHRRAGKTVAALQRLIHAAAAPSKPNCRYAYIAPLRVQAKNIAWDYLKAFTRAIPGLIINESELRVDFPTGSRIQLYGADNPDSLRGGYFDGAIMDEVPQMAPQTWSHVVRPMLSDRMGWAMFIATPAGKGAFFELWEEAAHAPGWARFMFRASDTGLINTDELEAARREMSESAYAQEFDCSFTAAIRGAYYGDILEQGERDGHVLAIDYDPSVAVTTGWDIGVSDATAIWIMMPYRGNAWAAIDYYESSGVGIDFYAAWLRGKLYRYYKHLAPHDVANQDWSAAGGLNRVAIAEQHGIRFERQPRPKDSRAVMDGIQAVRSLLPLVYFHSDDSARGQRVSRGRLALSLYRADYNDKLGALKASPVHDWCSHAADGMRTFATTEEDVKRAGLSRSTGPINRSQRITSGSRGSVLPSRLGARSINDRRRSTSRH